MAQHAVRFLHFSDLHERGARERERWRRRAVLGDEWLKNLAALAEDGPIDLVVCTGDVADWGAPDEYMAAAEFFQATLAALGMSSDRLFVVPGNHDVHRPTETAAWQALRRAAAELDALELSRWLGGGPVPRGMDATLPEQVLRRMTGWRTLLQALQRDELLPERSPHGLLGFRKTLQLPGRPFPVQVIGLDSTWLAGDDNDAGKLLLTEDQVGRLVTDASGAPLAGFRLALMHHPLSELMPSDHAIARRWLGRHVDLLLRGHLHDEELATLVEPDVAVRQLAAGCLYEGHRANHWPNACHVIEAILDDAGRPLRYEVRLRSWSPRGSFWHDDSSLYREALGGRLVWPVATAITDNVTATAPTAAAGGNPGSNPFQKAAALASDRVSYVRRSCDDTLALALKETPLITIHGDYGIGKSSLLVRARAMLQAERDVFHVDLQSIPTYDPERFHDRFFTLLGRTIPGVSDFSELGDAVGEQPLGILLDELGHLTDEVAKLFLPSLHHLATTHAQTVRVVACLPVPMARAARDFGLRNPKHWNDWHPVEVGPIDGTGISTLLGLLPPLAMQVALPRRDELYRRSGGRPQPIQTLCYELYEAVCEGAGAAALRGLIDAFDGFESAS